MKIVFYSPEGNAQPWLEEIGTTIPLAEVWEWTPTSADRQADYAVLWAPPMELFASQQRLKAVFNIGAGVDGVLKLNNLPPGVPIVRLNDAGMAVQMAEYVCYTLIRHTRNFDIYESHARNREWKRQPPIDRTAFPVGVMGLGNIGARVAQAVAAFEYPTFGWSCSEKTLPGVTSFAGPESMDAFLSGVRVLVCALPLTSATEGILNAGTLAKLQPNGYLINVARGRHLIENDLLAALDNGSLAGATLDVCREEPLPDIHPFWSHPKITITPHISAITLRAESVVQIADKIHALERGEAIDGIVETARGY
ncbi:MAG: glyoxylate/hydroxypyruvate reductase A [Burkholderiales bacterium]|nr:glyoxylate/hydroxypyruvate reductase A [Burkholderiales bacterium]